MILNPNINQIINLTKTFVVGELLNLDDIPALIDALQKEFKTVARVKKTVAKPLVTTVEEYHEMELFSLMRKKKLNSAKV